MAVSPEQPAAGPQAEGKIEAGLAVLGAGALLLFVSLFLNWYQPGRSAWAVFEVWDLVLAALSVGALAAVAGRTGLIGRRPDSWLVVPAGAAFVIVIGCLVNHPPAAVGHAPMVGIWLALVASLLMLGGVAVSVARVSVAVSLDDAGTAATAAAATAPARAVMAGRLRRAGSGESPASGAAEKVAAAAEATPPDEDQPTRPL